MEIKSVEYQDEIKRGIEIFPRPYLGHRNETEISLFGYSGNFRIKTYGKIYSYCNRWNRFVMIKSKDNYSYLLSPENRHEFIQDASKALREWKIQEKVCECPVCGVALKDMDHVCHRCGAEYMNVYKF